MKKLYIIIFLMFVVLVSTYFFVKVKNIQSPRDIQSKNNDCIISGHIIDVSKYDLDTVTGRQSYYDFLLTKRACEIWNIWDVTIARANPNELSTVVAALGHVLSIDNASDDMYKIISDRLYNDERSEVEKSAIISVLLYAKSPLSVKHLITFAKLIEENKNKTYKSSDLLFRDIGTIKEIYMSYVDGGRGWSLSPVFESEWRDIGDNELSQITTVIGDALGYLSKPSGVDLLINTMASTSKTSIKYKVAMNAISNLNANDSTETVLAPALVKYKNNDDIIKTVISGLLSIDSADSVIVVILYADSIKNSNTNYYKWIKSELIKSKKDEVKKVVSNWLASRK